GRHHRPIAERSDPGPRKIQGYRPRPHLVSRRDRLHPAKPSLSAVRQSEGAAGARDGGQPGGISQRRVWRRALWRACYSFFVCGSPNETEAGSEPYQKQDLARAKALLGEAGYKGEKVTLINTHEIASIGALGDVTANNLKKLGINVEIADSDWGTLVARRAKKEPPDKG